MTIDVSPVNTIAPLRNVAMLDELIERTIEAFGRLDVLFNNAGIGVGGEARHAHDERPGAVARRRLAARAPDLGDDARTASLDDHARTGQRRHG